MVSLHAFRLRTQGSRMSIDSSVMSFHGSRISFYGSSKSLHGSGVILHGFKMSLQGFRKERAFAASEVSIYAQIQGELLRVQRWASTTAPKWAFMSVPNPWVSLHGFRVSLHISWMSLHDPRVSHYDLIPSGHCLTPVWVYSSQQRVSMTFLEPIWLPGVQGWSSRQVGGPQLFYRFRIALYYRHFIWLK